MLSILDDVDVLSGRGASDQISVLQSDAATAGTTGQESLPIRDQSALQALSGALDSAVSEIEGGQSADYSQVKQEIDYALDQC